MSHIPKPMASLLSRTDLRVLKGGTRRYTRPRYNRYNGFDNLEIKQIQDLLQDAKYGDCAYLAFHHNIPSSTIRTWKIEIQKNPNYNIRDGYKRNRRAIFTNEEEEAIADYIRKNIINTGQFFSDIDFRYLMIAAYMEKYKDAEKTYEFNCSNGFIYAFKKKTQIFISKSSS